MYFVFKAATSILRPGRDLGCMLKIIFFSSRILVGLIKNTTSMCPAYGFLENHGKRVKYSHN